jgi:rubrerythrin
MFSANDILDLAIQIEQNGETAFRRAAEKVSNPSLAVLLEWIADEEVRHAHYFSNLRRGGIEKDVDDQVAEMGKALLRETLGAQVFSLETAEFSELRRVEDLLKVAMELERDTIIFYEMFRAFIEEKTALDILDTIIEQENSHLRKLQELHRAPPST